jgi:hypothetical protein
VRGTIGVLGVAGVFFGLGVVTAAGVACRRSGFGKYNKNPMSLVEVSTASQRRRPQHEGWGRYSDATEFSHLTRVKKYLYIN